MAGVGAGSVIFMGAYIRTVKILSGATAVQVVFHEYSGKKSMKDVGSAREEILNFSNPSTGHNRSRCHTSAGLSAKTRRLNHAPMISALN